MELHGTTAHLTRHVTALMEKLAFQDGNDE